MIDVDNHAFLHEFTDQTSSQGTQAGRVTSSAVVFISLGAAVPFSGRITPNSDSVERDHEVRDRRTPEGVVVEVYGEHMANAAIIVVLEHRVHKARIARRRPVDAT